MRRTSERYSLSSSRARAGGVMHAGVTTSSVGSSRKRGLCRNSAIGRPAAAANSSSSQSSCAFSRARPEPNSCALTPTKRQPPASNAQRSVPKDLSHRARRSASMIWLGSWPGGSSPTSWLPGSAMTGGRRLFNALAAKAISASLSGPLIARSPLTITTSALAALANARAAHQFSQKNPCVGDRWMSERTTIRAMLALTLCDYIRAPRQQKCEPYLVWVRSGNALTGRSIPAYPSATDPSRQWAGTVAQCTEAGIILDERSIQRLTATGQHSLGVSGLARWREDQLPSPRNEN